MLFNKENFNQEFPKYFEKELKQIYSTLNYFGYFEVENMLDEIGETLSQNSSGYVNYFKNFELGLEIDLRFYLHEIQSELYPGDEEISHISITISITSLLKKSCYFNLRRYFKNKNIPFPGCKVDENVIENVRKQLNLIQVTLMKDLAPMLRGEIFIDHSNESLQDYYDALSAAELNPEQEAIDEHLKNKMNVIQNIKLFIKSIFNK